MKYLLVGLVAVAFGVAQLLLGGTWLLYSIPACALVACGGLLSAWPKLKTDDAVRPWCLISTCCFSAYLLARIRFSPVDYLARTDFVIVTGALATYLVTALFLSRSKYRTPIVWALLVLALAQVAVGAIQFRAGNQFMILPWTARLDHTWRASGFYISANHFAGMLEVTALLAINLVCWGQFKLPAKIAIGYVAASCIFGLALSGSRGGYLSLAAGVLTSVAIGVPLLRKVSRGPFWPRVLAISAGLALGAGCVAVLVLRSPVLVDRVAAINDPTNMRLTLWRAALEQFHLDPTWGTGSGTYLYYGRLFRDPTVQNDPIYVHNDYLHLLAEYGSVGAGLFLIFFGTHVVSGVRNIRRLVTEKVDRPAAAGNQLALQIGAFSAVMAYTVHSIVDFNLHIPANAILMAWIFGMIANPAIVTAQNSRLRPFVRTGSRVALVAVSAAILIYGLPKLPGEWWARKAQYLLLRGRSRARDAGQKDGIRRGPRRRSCSDVHRGAGTVPG
jgi:O-antigen ligase